MLPGWNTPPQRRQSQSSTAGELRRRSGWPPSSALVVRPHGQTRLFMHAARQLKLPSTQGTTQHASHCEFNVAYHSIYHARLASQLLLDPLSKVGDIVIDLSRAYLTPKHGEFGSIEIQASINLWYFHRITVAASMVNTKEGFLLSV